MSGAYEHFFDVMEDLGFFEHIYEELPEDFSAVFEIARILEDEHHELSRQLLPALRLSTAAANRQKTDDSPNLQVFVSEAEEYDAGLIRSPQHLPRIYNSQWLLPDEVFEQRLAKKELWVPYPREPHYYSVDPDSDDYNPDSRKQKLYVLLDTSASMAVHNRISLAKALVYYFLKHNMKELGYIHLRTFDTVIGDLHEARDSAGFRALISFVMRLHTLGNGTAMAKAIRQAVDDINSLPQLSGTEILIVTDGACNLDEHEMKQLLGDSIVIHTVKIGTSRLYASRTYIDDQIREGGSARQRLVRSLRQRETELRRKLARTDIPQLKHSYENSLRGLERELQKEMEIVSDEISESYGNALGHLSDLFLEVDDVDLTALIEFGERQLDEIRAMYEQISKEIDSHCSMEKLRRLALIMDHLTTMLRHSSDETLHRRLVALQREISQKISVCIEAQLESASGMDALHLTSEDMRDMRFLLSGGGLHFSIWRLLLRKLIVRLKGMIGSQAFTPRRQGRTAAKKR